MKPINWPIPDETILANASARRRHEQARRREESAMYVLKFIGVLIVGAGLGWIFLG